MHCSGNGKEVSAAQKISICYSRMPQHSDESSSRVSAVDSILLMRYSWYTDTCLQFFYSLSLSLSCSSWLFPPSLLSPSWWESLIWEMINEQAYIRLPKELFRTPLVRTRASLVNHHLLIASGCQWFNLMCKCVLHLCMWEIIVNGGDAFVRRLFGDRRLLYETPLFWFCEKCVKNGWTWWDKAEAHVVWFSLTDHRAGGGGRQQRGKQ